MAKVRKALRVTITKEDGSYKLWYEGSLGSTDLTSACELRVKKYEELPQGLSEADLSKIFDIVAAAFNAEHSVE